MTWQLQMVYKMMTHHTEDVKLAARRWVCVCKSPASERHQLKSHLNARVWFSSESWVWNKSQIRVFWVIFKAFQVQHWSRSQSSHSQSQSGYSHVCKYMPVSCQVLSVFKHHIFMRLFASFCEFIQFGIQSIFPVWIHFVLSDFACLSLKLWIVIKDFTRIIHPAEFMTRQIFTKKKELPSLKSHHSVSTSVPNKVTTRKKFTLIFFAKIYISL